MKNQHETCEGTGPRARFSFANYHLGGILLERKITVTMSEYKAVALDMALAGKETSIQQELEKTLAKLPPAE